MCQQFPFTWGQRRGEEEEKGGGGNGWDDGEIAVVYLYGTSSPRETEQGKKSFFFLLLRWWIYCANKKRICIEDPCLIAIEKPKTWWDVNLLRSSLFFFQCVVVGGLQTHFEVFNPIKKTIIYLRAGPEESARPLFSVSQTQCYFYKWGE